MRQPRLLRALAVLLIASFFFGAFGGALAGASPEGGAGGRAADIEPDNDYINSAPDIISDQVFSGSLLTSPTTDVADGYHAVVDFGQVINASLHIDNFCSTTPWAVDFDLYLAYINAGNLVTLASSTGNNIWEKVYYMQMYVPSVDVYVIVQVNASGGVPTTLKGNYTLSVTVADALSYTPGQTLTGFLDVGGTLTGNWLKIADNLVPIDKVLDLKLQCPSNANFNIYVDSFWKSDPNYIWYMNGSWSTATGNTEEVKVAGIEGYYFIQIDAASGGGSYTLTSDTSTPTLNLNNSKDNPIKVRDNNWHMSNIDLSVDPIDWWSVNLKAGKNLTEAFFSLAGTVEQNNLYIMYIYDGSMNLRGSRYNTENGSLPISDNPPNHLVNTISIKNTPATVDGPMYACIRALAHVHAESGFVPARGPYKMTFTLPNDPPLQSGAVPEVRMDEDGTYDSLLLSTYFSDPEGDKLTYGILGSDYKTKPIVDNETGLVTLKPMANWSGTETVRFRVTDDGPGNKWRESNFTVAVNPVNDPPFLVEDIPDITIPEDSQTTTPDLSGIFGDIDNPITDLKFNLKVLSSETHPPGSNLAVQYDAAGHMYKLGPATLFFGHFLLQATCTDGAAGTVPVASTFNLTITHKNHRPALRETIADPMELSIKEHDKDSHLALSDLFSDPDTAENYANDALNYTVTGAQKLTVGINDDGYLVIDTGKEQYMPGVKYEEKLLITCTDKAGLKATLNLTVTIEPVNDPPRIVTANPVDGDVAMSEGTRKMFSIAAIDDDTLTLIYSWFVNGKKDKNAKGLSFAFEPDSTMGGEIYTVRVEVSDLTTTVNKEWNVTVNEVNRLPVGVIKTPLNMTKFKKGTFVTFTAEGTDEDGDALTFIWKDAAGVELGRGTTFSTDKLPKGVQTITCEINDGKGFSTQKVTVVIVAPETPAPSGFLPGFEGALVVLALGMTVALAQLRRHRRRAC